MKYWLSLFIVIGITVCQLVHAESPIDCLAKNIYFEARGESLIGQIFVADVTLNRVDSPLFKDSICEVVKDGKYSEWHKQQGRQVPIKHKCHFSWFCDGKSDEPDMQSTSWGRAFNISKHIIETGEFRGISEGSTHYHTTKVNPNWVNDKGMKYIVQVGDHIFYKWW